MTGEIRSYRVLRIVEDGIGRWLVCALALDQTHRFDVWDVVNTFPDGVHGLEQAHAYIADVQARQAMP